MSRYTGIYEHFERFGYKHDTITEAINMLDRYSLSDLHKREGVNLEMPVFMECKTYQEREFVKKVRINVYRQVQINLDFICGNIKFSENKELLERKDKNYFDFINSLDKNVLNNIIEISNGLSRSILCLKFDLPNRGKWYSNAEISTILNVDLEIVRDVIGKALLLYKEKINEILDYNINCIKYEQLEIKNTDLKV